MCRLGTKLREHKKMLRVFNKTRFSLINIRVEAQSEIKDEILNHYQSLLGTADERVSSTPDELESILKFQWSSNHLQILGKPITDSEIKELMFSLNGEKAPGRDDFNAFFF